MSRETRSPSRARNRRRTGSSQFPFDEEDLEDFVVLYGAVSEIAVFAEQLSMVGGDGDVGVFRNGVEQLLHHAVEIAHGFNLPLAKHIEFIAVEHLLAAGHQLSAHHM